MKEPILVVMAAGMGSRYGGLKQIDPVGLHGEIIIDYSLYDAYLAGFRRVIFIIKKDNAGIFREVIGSHIDSLMEAHYVYQTLDDLPDGYAVPAGREKPWGTGHAVLACRNIVDAPFAVINADDFYGRDAFEQIFAFLSQARDDGLYRYAMVGYPLKNTMTESGSVARGICSVENGVLAGIEEHTRIERRNGKIEFTEDGGNTWRELAPDTTVSMNLWGFTPSLLQELGSRFPSFLDKILRENPLKGEYFLPSIINLLLEEGKAEARVLRSGDQWFGVTYREDKPRVQAAIRQLIADGRYPEYLWKGLGNK